MDFDKFLEQDNVRDLISQNNLERVYELLPVVYRPEFTNYLKAKGINALEYLNSYIPTTAFEGIAELPAEIQINNSVTHIKYDAFYANEQIKTVILPASLIEISSYAFRNCSNLTIFIYPGTVDELRAVTFGEYWFNWGMRTVKCSDDICTITYTGEIKDKSFIQKGNQYGK